MNKPIFNITENYYKENYEEIKEELQSYVDATVECCGKDSEEHIEAIEIQSKILEGDLEELGSYLSESYYAISGEIDKFLKSDVMFVKLIRKLPSLTRIK